MIFFFPLTLGKSSCLLVPGEWSQQHRGTLLLQVEVLVLNICDQNRVGSVPFQLWDLGCILLNAIFNQGLLLRLSGDVFSMAGGWIFLGKSSFLTSLSPEPSHLPSLRCLISLSQRRAIGLCSLRGDISAVTHPPGLRMSFPFYKILFFSSYCQGDCIFFFPWSKKVQPEPLARSRSSRSSALELRQTVLRSESN